MGSPITSIGTKAKPNPKQNDFTLNEVTEGTRWPSILNSSGGPVYDGRYEGDCEGEGASPIANPAKTEAPSTIRALHCTGRIRLNTALPYHEET